MSEEQIIIPVGKSASNLVAGMSVLRADDFISLEFEFINLQVSMPSPGKPALTMVNHHIFPRRFLKLSRIKDRLREG